MKNNKGKNKATGKEAPAKKGKAGNPAPSRKNNLWSPQAECALIDEMLRFKRMTNYTGSFNHSDLAKVVARNANGEAHTTLQVTQKIQRFRGAWVAHQARTNKTGMGFDPESNEPYCDPATLERQFGTAEDPGDIQRIPCGRMSALDEIFRRSAATGRFGQSSAVLIEDSDDEPPHGGKDRSKNASRKKGRSRDNDEPDPSIPVRCVPRIPPRMPPGVHQDETPSKKSKSSSDWKTALSDAAKSIEQANNLYVQKQMESQLHIQQTENDLSRTSYATALCRLQLWRPCLSFKQYQAAAESLKDEYNRRWFMTMLSRKADRKHWIRSQPIPSWLADMNIPPDEDEHDSDAWEEVDDDEF